MRTFEEINQSVVDNLNDTVSIVKNLTHVISNQENQIKELELELKAYWSVSITTPKETQ